MSTTDEGRSTPPALASPAGEAGSTIPSASAFEHLAAELATTFVHIAAEAVDQHIDAALGRIAQALELDRSAVVQRVGGHFQVTHEWTRPGFPGLPSAVIPEEALPWVADKVLRRQEPMVATRLSDYPPEAAAERLMAERTGVKANVILPLVVATESVGAMTFADLRHEREWPAPTLDRFRLVAQIVASALARKGADLALRRAHAFEALVAELSTTLAGILTEPIDGQIETTLRQIAEFLGAERATVLQQVAATDVPVLLLGETGTGKELMARTIHARSGRGPRPLIAVNCAALPPPLIESELFGHEKGAFTGATQMRPGRFELADGSTLFLDEIGDLDPALQAKLLRVLQDGQVQRLGGNRTQKVDVRIIAATNRDPEAALAEGRLRPDLYYRLSVFPIVLPPLRSRREDIPLLVWHFIQSRRQALGRRVREVPPTVMQALVDYNWPGNVRELQNVIDRALLLSPGLALQIDEALGLARSTDQAAPSPPAGTLENAERAHILGVLEACRWVVEGPGQAADRLGLRPSTLRSRMRKLHIQRPRSV